MARPIDHVHKIRAKTGQMLRLWGELELLKLEYQKLGIGSTLTDADFADQDITKQEFTDGIAGVLNVMATMDTNGAELFTISDGSHRK